MIGAALPLVRAVSGLLAALCLVIVLVTMQANGVLVLATIFGAIFCWSVGMFTRGFWISGDPEYSRIDQQLDEEARHPLQPVAGAVVARQTRMPALVRIDAATMAWIILGGALAVTGFAGLIVGAVLS